MLQPNPVPATSFAERLRARAGSRTLGMGLALLVEALLLLLLLTLSAGELPGEKDGKAITVVNLQAEAASEEASEQAPPEPEQRTEEQPITPEPTPPRPAELPEIPPPVVIVPPPAQAPPAAVPARPAPPVRRVYGPPDKRGGSASSRDTERVGTAPNGEPLYAAAWYREPRDDELSGYMATARGPGWGLIACRTVPDYRVEDCVALDEYPAGSQINRAVLAAAWQFKVRPPRLGGRSQVGSWVRIRIDYGIKRR